ncbi:MAG: bifunctional folylpolyglutamate synthase/dihydrofolate synthase [Calditrichaeota bacterium]|nr:bifunctional folylpolyglutamate synthase/dihydrofolate synthase [Calditrichota bacterium]
MRISVEKTMNYAQAVDYLFSLTSLGWKLGLNKIRSLLKELDNPHEKYRVIHVGGTNGKGSTSSMLASILQQSGYRTGLFTSPHLIRVGERIKIDGLPISREDLVFYIEKLKPLFTKYKCTFFEALTAIGFTYFADQKVEVAVIEVGLGGRLDATNVVNPLLSIITNVNFDHMKQLGYDRKSIAREKAGIIKENSICITNNKYQSVARVFAEAGLRKNTKLISLSELMRVNNAVYGEEETVFDLAINGSFFPRLRLSLLGPHQVENAALAVTAAKILQERFLPLKNDDIYAGLAQVNWPGRLQLISKKPRLLADVAHNPDGARALAKSVQKIFHYRRLYLLMGVMRDKEYEKMIKRLAPMVHCFIAVSPDYYRSLVAKKLAQSARKYCRQVKSFGQVFQGIDYALKQAKEDDLIVCTGSHFTIGEVLQYFE